MTNNFDAAREGARQASGEFGTQARRPNASLGLPADTGNPVATQQARDLSDLADDLLDEMTPFIPDDLAPAHAIVPNVPEHLLSNELWHDVLSATVARDDDRRAKALDVLVKLDAREARWREDATFDPPTGEASEIGTGTVVYTTTTGSKYTGFRPVAEVAKDIRMDLKDAVDAGYLPDGLDFRVNCDKAFAGGQALSVTVRGMTDKKLFRDDPVSWDGGRRYSATTGETLQRVEAIAGAYSEDITEPQTDYANVMYYSRVHLETESDAQWRINFAAEQKAKRKAKS